MYLTSWERRAVKVSMRHFHTTNVPVTNYCYTLTTHSRAKSQKWGEPVFEDPAPKSRAQLAAGLFVLICVRDGA
jgi:hypothetical protein